MKLCAYEECTRGPDGGRGVIDPLADERKRFCMDRCRMAAWKLGQERRNERIARAAKRAERPRTEKSLRGAPQVSFNRAVAALELALRECLALGQPAEHAIPALAREYMMDALPEKQRRRLEEAGNA